MPPTQALLVGCPPEVAEAAAAEVNRVCTHCRVVRTASGFLADHEYETFFKAHPKVDLIFLGMGTPNSQRIAPIAAAQCPQSVIWHAGAGTIHFYGGTMKEAPEWWRRVGLQWLHRLALDPRAYWRRYLLGNPLFVARILAARLRGGRKR
jgi:exopolysaccharide biosynthesis WecB/TagA/CpsF family protein